MQDTPTPKKDPTSDPTDSQSSSVRRQGLTPDGHLPRIARMAAGICMALTALFHVGCAGTSTLPKRLAAETPGVLAPGDVLKVAFPGAPELNESQKIRPDGKLSLPRIGLVSAGGKRLAQFQDELTELYKSELKDSEVVVSVDSSTVPVYVTGAVVKPGKVLLDRPMTVLEAIMEVGGANNVANLHRVVVIRNANGRHYTEAFDLSSTLKGRPANAFYLRAYDMIYVPERFF